MSIPRIDPIVIFLLFDCLCHFKILSAPCNFLVTRYVYLEIQMNLQRSRQIIIERIRKRKSVYKYILPTKKESLCDFLTYRFMKETKEIKFRFVVLYKVYPLQERTAGARAMKKVHTNLCPVLSS